MIKMEFLHNDTLAIYQSSSDSKETAIPDIALLNQDGTKNIQNVVSYSVNSGETVNIEDVYHHKGFDFSGMRKIADELNYLSPPINAVYSNERSYWRGNRCATANKWPARE